MLSVIVSSRDPASSVSHRRGVGRSVGLEHRYIRIPNPRGRIGLAAAYNIGVSRSSGEILAFVHEDVSFLTRGWGRVLEGKFRADPSVGLIGVAGTRRLLSDDLRWGAAGPAFTRGRVVHALEGGRSRSLGLFSWNRDDAEVVAVDGLFFAVRRKLFDRVRFDEESFPGFHFYDLDLGMQVRRTARCVVTWDILVEHHSSGRRDAAWSEAAERFREKYRDELPASCANTPRERGERAPLRHYDLGGEGGRVLRRLGLLGRR